MGEFIFMKTPSLALDMDNGRDPSTQEIHENPAGQRRARGNLLRTTLVLPVKFTEKRGTWGIRVARHDQVKRSRRDGPLVMRKMHHMEHVGSCGTDLGTHFYVEL